MNFNYYANARWGVNVFRFLLIMYLSILPLNFVYGQGRQITLTGKNITLLKAFEAIEKQTQLSITYNQTKLNVSHVINVDYKNKNLSVVLEGLLRNTGFTYKQEGNYVIIVPVEPSSPGEQHPKGKVKTFGQVVDALGDAVIGASIMEKGTSNGTITDLEGKFSLDVTSSEAVLNVSYIGYRDQALKVSIGKPLAVTLHENTQALEEVVVVGYTTQKRESLTGAMQVMKKEKLLDVTTPSAENLLTGKAPGVYVNGGSGQPGSTGKIVIRGKIGRAHV